MKRFFFILCFLYAFQPFLFSQKRVVLDLDFDKNTYFADEQNKIFYLLNNYIPDDKGFIEIYSSRKDSIYAKYYTEAICDEPDNLKHGFFVATRVYEKPTPSYRELIVAKLDSPTVVNSSYLIRLEAKYSLFSKYYVDSLYVLFVTDENDIKSWLAGKSFKGLTVSFSLKKTDNSHWDDLQNYLIAKDVYRYVVIGNLNSDEKTKVVRKNTCNDKKKSAFEENIGEVLLDNIKIVEK